MELSPGLRAIQRWWLFIAIVAALAGALAYAASYLLSPSYSSSTRVLVRARDARFLSSTGEDIASRPSGVDIVQPKSLSQTLAGLATSRGVAEQVVRELALDQPRPRELSLLEQARAALKAWARTAGAYLQYGFYAERPPFEEAVERVRSNVEAIPIKDSYVVQIKVRAEDPDLAAAMAEAVTRAFVRQSLDEFQRNAANYRAVLAREVDRARDEVERAEAALRAYREAHGIADVAEAMRLAAADEEAIRQQLRDVEAELTAARARHAALERTLAGLTPVERSSTSASVRSTTSTATSAEAGRGVTTTVNETTTGTAEDRRTESPNRVYQEVQRETLLVAAQIAGLESKRTALADTLGERARASAQLAEHAARIGALELERSSAHATYTAIRSTYEAAVLNDARGAEEVAQIDAATRPLYPDRPLRYLFALLGLVCGLAGGASLAVVIDRWSPSWLVRARPLPAPAGTAAIRPEAPAPASGTPAPGLRRYEI